MRLVCPLRTLASADAYRPPRWASAISRGAATKGGRTVLQTASETSVALGPPTRSGPGAEHFEPGPDWFGGQTLLNATLPAVGDRTADLHRSRTPARNKQPDPEHRLRAPVDHCPPVHEGLPQ